MFLDTIECRLKIIDKKTFASHHFSPTYGHQNAFLHHCGLVWSVFRVSEFPSFRENNSEKFSEFLIFSEIISEFWSQDRKLGYSFRVLKFKKLVFVFLLVQIEIARILKYINNISLSPAIDFSLLLMSDGQFRLIPRFMNKKLSVLNPKQFSLCQIPELLAAWFLCCCVWWLIF